MKPTLETGELVSYLYPITSVSSLPNGVMIVNRSCRFPPKVPQKGQSNPIRKLSKKSLSRLALLVAVNSHKFHSMLTLTYGVDYPINGRRVKKDLNRFLLSFKRSFGQSMSYCWFLEFQRRGAPHLHVYSSVGVINGNRRAVVAKLWCRAQQRDDVPYSRYTDGREMQTMSAVKMFHVKQSRTWEVFKHRDGATRYALKYSLKARQKTVPNVYSNVGRFWGVSRDCNVYPKTDIECNETDLRDALSVSSDRFEDFDILPRILFV